MSTVGEMSIKQDYIGYGVNPPKVVWPNAARLCISFVINYEEGGETSILNGDNQSEAYLTEIIGTNPINNDRNYVVESCYEYGSRVGIYRLLSVFKKYNIKTTIYAVAKALQKNPSIIKLFKEHKHDIASHHYRWGIYGTRNKIPYETEKRHLFKVMNIHKDLCNNQTPKGMYIGGITNNTKKILYEYNDYVSNKNEKILWHSDCYNDDIPYWDRDTFQLFAKNKRNNIPLLNIPYTLNNNDMRYLLPNGYVTSDQFYLFCKNSFDQLLKEGGKMMSIGLHGRITGHPGRLVGLQRFVEYIMQPEFKDKIWIATRTEIYDFWLKHYPPSIQLSKL
eukprot:478123_1